MIALVTLASWAFLALAAGLITGTPSLRTFGGGLFVLFTAAAYLVDRFSVARHPLFTDVVEDDDFAAVEFDWPGYRGAA